MLVQCAIEELDRRGPGPMLDWLENELAGLHALLDMLAAASRTQDAPWLRDAPSVTETPEVRVVSRLGLCTTRVSLVGLSANAEIRRNGPHLSIA